MSEQNLDHTDIGAIFQQMGSKTVAQRMGADALGQAGGLCRLLDDARELAGGDRLARVLAWKQPTAGQHHTLAPTFLPLRSRVSRSADSIAWR